MESSIVPQEGGSAPTGCLASGRDERIYTEVIEVREKSEGLPPTPPLGRYGEDGEKGEKGEKG
jgi:hypothetical protein